MPKIGMEPVRRRQVIDATMVCIHEEGVAKASLQRIAKRAGITSGLILHYFEGKENLFIAVYRDLYKRLGDETILRLKQSENPTDRLFAVLETQVSAEMVDPVTVSTWFAIGAKASETPSLARMEHINSKRLVSNLIHILKHVGLSAGEAQEVAEELRAMVYGLWCNLAHGSIHNSDQAKVILFRYLRARIPQLLDSC